MKETGRAVEQLIPTTEEYFAAYRIDAACGYFDTDGNDSANGPESCYVL